MFGPEFILIVCGVSDVSCGVSDIVKQYAWHCLDWCQQQLDLRALQISMKSKSSGNKMHIYYCTSYEALSALVTLSGAYCQQDRSQTPSAHCIRDGPA
jgi:hypothetical protein